MIQAPPTAPPDTSLVVLKTQNLSRWYGQVIGVNDLTVDVSPGVTGLLGLNGAGKSTLFKLMAGQLKPSAGVVRVCGHDLAHHRGLYRLIGFLAEPDALYESMTGREMLVYLTRLQGFTKDEANERTQRALQRTHLLEAADRRVKGYSKGMRQKIKLAQALAHDPQILFLDEPFNGMDPVSRKESMDLIKELGAEGKTVMVSSHILHEVEAMTSRILLIHRGQILADGDIGEIRDAIERHPHRIEVHCESPRALATEFIALKDVQGLRVSSEHSLLLESDLPREVYRMLPEFALRPEMGVRSWTTLDDNLKSLFEYLVEDGR
ncbi:MAG TPA: ABC transporter ATP-binding protein [Candidatus Krumholzibacteria bacterium]|nr:ABC transporter ATP-binding protein [Candidatus Krumholzibacteria bacterium]